MLTMTQKSIQKGFPDFGRGLRSKILGGSCAKFGLRTLFCRNNNI